MRKHLRALLIATICSVPVAAQAQYGQSQYGQSQPGQVPYTPEANAAAQNTNFAAHVPRPSGQPTRPQTSGTQQTEARGIFLNVPQFDIPFSVASVGTQPQEVQLYLSRDAGARWELFARQPANSRNFPFTAPEDGDYWFATRTIDVSGAAHPAGPVQPQLRVTVDTENPNLEARADADGNGQVIVDYRITDVAPEAKSLRVEYMTDSVRQWMAVDSASQPVNEEKQGVSEGRLVWVPESDWRHVYIRLIVRDRAGNQTVLTRQVEKPRMARQEIPAKLASSPLLPPPPLPDNQPPVYANPAAIEAIAASQRSNGPLTGHPQRSNMAQQPFNPVYNPPAPRQPVAQQVQQAPAAAAPATPNWPTPSAFSQAAPGAANLPATAANGQGNPTPPARENRWSPPATQYVAQTPSSHTIRGMEGPLANSNPQTTNAYPTSHDAQIPTANNPSMERSSAPPEFGLNPPLSTRTNPESTPADAGTPANSEPPAPRTPQDALRPLAVETSENSRTQLTASGQRTSASNTEMVPTPPATADTYTSAPSRSTPATSANADNEPTDTVQSQRPALQFTQSISVDDMLASGAAIRQSDTRTFSLDYEVESIGRQGVETVELWATKDVGRSWTRWDADPDGQSPFDIITGGDGVYGFRIVVIGRNGLASPRPQAGEDADIFVLVDTTKPTVRITGARYGEQDDTGKLLITYQCEDSQNNLARRPVTLKFSETPQGPWTTIATGLENDGFYAWPADPELPSKIYLRVEATDRAENVGHDTLDQPIAVEGLAPRARIRGFQPVHEESAEVPAARFR
ncbi:hypothetical protein FF011L_50090 [Roseimaritima multifibrata]|uniref:Ser-Thr-rich glycosyl-phosphatidyl-inositol-anchored membrane family protein n=1 Tax=Roseimaritima multifibrata TaxID=1930274 RepID=A0A517MMV3_9BACT|nr:hypothetical protein [Roseimaritima multifibrata]QDS96201.1 hypothetical protein FF011L_50090 [Roseimaritima multifibrata]